MKKALRIGYNRYYDETVFKEHLEYVKKNLPYIDEITVIVEFSHTANWSLDFCRKSAEILKDRISRYREVGVKSIGINVLVTMGHSDEAWDILPKLDLQYMIDEFGDESRSCLCPSNDEFLNYISEKYGLFASTGADFIWSDDDIRPIEHGFVHNGCFCPKCIKKFNNEYKMSLTREELAEKLKKDGGLLDNWTRFHKDVIKTVHQTIADSIHKVDKSVKMGLMTTHLTVGENREAAQITGAEKCRPGGGFYNEDIPAELLDKIYSTQLQVYEYKDIVDDIQYEYEAFNYQNLNKSMHITEVESNLAILSGCNGILYNNDIFNDRDDIIELFKKCKDMWDRLLNISSGMRPGGVYCAGYYYLATYLNEIGIPLTACKDKAVASIILGNGWNNLSDDEISGFLDKPLITDGAGLDILCKRGFEERCGGKVRNIYTSSMAERFSDNELNGEFKNYYRDVFINFMREGDAYELEPADGSTVLANLETISHIPKGCAMYISNDKFVVDGYLMPKSLLLTAKQEQLLNVIDKITDYSLPVRISKSLRVAPMVTSDDDGNMCVMLVNMSLDNTGCFVCEVRGTGKFYRICADGELSEVPQRHEGGNTVITVENIERMDYILLTNKR